MAVDFSRFPLPDLPAGLHGPSTVGSLDYPSRFGSLRAWMGFLRAEMGMGCYTALLEPGFSVLTAVEAAAGAGLLVVARPQPDGGEPHPRMQLNPPNVRSLRDAGASYVQLGNEPDNAGEWNREEGGIRRGWLFVDALGNQIMDMAAKAISVNMPVLLPPMNAGYPSYDRAGNVTDDGTDRVSHLNFFRWAEQTGNLGQLKVWAAAGFLAVAVHNRPANHYPPEYPNDPICLNDPDYFQNRLGITDPVLRLRLDGTSFDSYKNIDDLNVVWLGRSVPLFGTEAGYTPEVADDSRYRKIKDDPDIRDPRFELGHAAANIELIARFAPSHIKRHRPALVGLMFYHGLYAGDSFVEAWWQNKLYGRDLAIVTLLPEWWETHATEFDNWRDRWLGATTETPAGPAPEPPIVVLPAPDPPSGESGDPPDGPTAEPEPPIVVAPVTGRRRIFGSHLQYATNDAVESTDRERGIGIKTMDSSVEPIRRLLDREAHPIVTVRHFFELSEQAEYRAKGREGAKIVADRVAQNFAEIQSYCTVRGVPVFAEALNEPDPNPHGDLGRLADWYVDFAGFAADAGFRPLAYSWGTGNPPSYGWGPNHPAGFSTYFESLAAQMKTLAPGYRACAEAGGGGAWHAYDWPGWMNDPYWQGLRLLNDLDALAVTDSDLAAVIRIFVTECSIDVGIRPEYVAAAGERKGWRTALGGDEDLLIRQAMSWRRALLDSKWGQNVVLVTPFTRGPDFVWLDYSFDNLPKWEHAIANEGKDDPMPRKPKPTTITPLHTPSGEPGGRGTFRFRASGIDGQAKGFADVEYPLVPGTSQSYYGPNQTTEIGPFGDGEQTIDFEIGPAAQSLPGSLAGELRLRLYEAEGDVGDYAVDLGTYGPFPVTIAPALSVPQTPPIVQPGRMSARDALDQLWALGEGFAVNGDHEHENYIKNRVIVLKDALGIA